MGSCQSMDTVLDSDNKPPTMGQQPVSYPIQPETFKRIEYFKNDEKDISNEELFHYIKEQFFDDWQSQAKKNQIDLLINKNHMNFTFQSEGKTTQEQFDNYIKLFTENFNLLKGLKLKFQSQLETQVKRTLYQDGQLKNKLKEIYNIDNFIVSDETHANEKNVLVFLAQFCKKSIFGLKEIVEQSVAKEIVKDSVTFYGYSKQDIKKFIKTLLQNYESVDIQWNIKEEAQQKFLILSYITWKIKETDLPGDILRLKQEVAQQFMHLEIEVSDKTGIFIWNQLVSTFYKTGNEKYQCVTKYFTDNRLVIELKGYKKTINGIKYDIENNLQQYNLFHIALTCHKDEQIFEFFGKKKISELFKKSLKKIEEQFKNSKARIFMDSLTTYGSNGQGNLSGKVIFDSKQYQIKEVQDVVQNHFLNQLEIYQIKCEILNLLQFLSLKDIIQFEEEYEVYVHRVQSQVFFIGLKEQLEVVKTFLNQIDQMTEEQQEQGTINLISNIILKQIQSLINSQKIAIPENAKVTFDRKLNLIIVCNKKVLNSTLALIGRNVDQLQQEIVSYDCKFNEQQIELLFTKNIQEIENIQNQFNCQIQEISSQNIQQQQQKIFYLSQLNYMGKTLSLVQNDIVNISCDMIVNSCNQLLSFGNPDLLSGVAKSISLFAGNQYQVFCQNFIKQKSELLLGETLIYEMPPKSTIKFILNVVTPIYEHSEQITQNFTSIQENLQAIFQDANQRGIQSLAIPLLGCGACGIAFKEAAAVIVNQIIDLFFNNSCRLTKIYIVELYEKRMNDLQEILQQQLRVVEQREVKFQWQWLADQNNYKDFDDLDINRQIDESYDDYLNDNSKNQIQLKFSYSKQPGTHEVDLVQNQVRDLAVTHIQPLTTQTNQNNKCFFINGIGVDTTLNEYLILKEMLGETKFQIFFKEYRIHFNQNIDQMFQENATTHYKRKIRYVKLDTKKYLQNKNILIGKEFQLNHYSSQNRQEIQDKVTDQNQQKNILRIFSLSSQNNINVEKALQNFLDQMIIQKEISIPNLFIEDLERFEFMINKFAIKYEGKIVGLQKIQIQILKQQENDFIKELDQFSNLQTSYPSEWTKQDTNMIKVQLNPTDPEYNFIENTFKETETGTNKSLWENYISEKKRILKRYQGNNQLTKKELERYLWHGVRTQHPQIIYQGENEAFDVTYSSNACMWGNGIYFAEKASYSRGYSFVLNGQQDPDLSGKFVFLCCLVTTGKLDKQNPNNQLKRPSKGDCVTGFTNGSDVFILYAMDVRRAYPAYEVIYS